MIRWIILIVAVIAVAGGVAFMTQNVTELRSGADPGRR